MKRFLVMLGIVPLVVGMPALAGDKGKSAVDKATSDKADASMAEVAKPAAAATAAAEHRIYAPGDLKWGEAPPGLPKARNAKQASK